MNTDIEQARHAAMEKYGTEIDKLNIADETIIQELLNIIEEYRQLHAETCGESPYNWRTYKERCDLCKKADGYLGVTC